MFSLKLSSVLISLIIGFVFCEDCSDWTLTDIVTEELIRAAKAVGIGLAIAVVGTLAINLVLNCCGFTRSGVRYSSPASDWQSDIGDVESGSCFATLQSLGAKGCCSLAGPLGGILLAGAIFGYYFLGYGMFCDKSHNYDNTTDIVNTTSASIDFNSFLKNINSTFM